MGEVEAPGTLGSGEGDMVPLGGDNGGAEAGDATTTEGGAGIGGGEMEGVLDGGFGGDTAEGAGLFEGEVEAVLEVEAMVFEVEGPQPGIVVFEVFGFLELSDQPEFGDPIESIAAAPGIDGEVLEGFGPGVDQWGTAGEGEIAGSADGVEVGVLDLEGGGGLGGGEGEFPTPGGIAGEGAEGIEGLGEAGPGVTGLMEDGFEDQGGGAGFQPGGEGGEIGVAEDDMEPAPEVGVGVRFVAGIDKGTALHGIDALQLGEKITALGDLEVVGKEAVFGFDGELAGAGEDLSGDQEGLDGIGEEVPGEGAGDQVIFVATVAVSVEVGVVFVEPDGVTAEPGEGFGAGHGEAFAGAVVGDEVIGIGAFGGAVFGMGVVVVEAGAVGQGEVAFDFGVGQCALGVLGDVMGFVEILTEGLDVEAPHIAVGVFGGVIPSEADAGFGGAADQGDGFGDHVDGGVIAAGDAEFGFQAEEDGGGRHGKFGKLKLES